MDHLSDCGPSTAIPLAPDVGCDAFDQLLADDATAALALLSTEAPARHDASTYDAAYDAASGGDAAEARATGEPEVDLAARPDVVMAEVAAVIALIAQEHATNAGHARPYAPPRLPLRREDRTAEIRRLPVAVVDPTRPREVKGSCTIIAFPGPAARPTR